jgi:hypothetical protein
VAEAVEALGRAPADDAMLRHVAPLFDAAASAKNKEKESPRVFGASNA